MGLAIVSSQDSVNFQSLNVVRDELVATIEEAARHLEKFVTSQEDSEALQACIECIGQIAGTLRLIEFGGAELLAKELLKTANEISPGNSGPKYERRLEVVSSTFFVLTRYLEFVQQTQRKVPILLLPQINDLRKLRGEPAFPESHFIALDVAKLPAPAVPEVESLQFSGSERISAIRRTRHMYQIGLLGMFKEHQLRNSISMMRRALKRLHRMANKKPLGLLWWLGETALGLMNSQKMDILETRKVLFGRIDRIIRQVEKAGDSALDAEPPKGLIKELAYLIAISGAKDESVLPILKNYKLQNFPFNDKALSNERDLLNGPSAHTVTSLANVLQTELANTKKVLEGASQSSVQRIDDIESFVATLQKVAEILSIVGLVSASNTLRNELKRIETWKDEDELSQQEMDEVANTLLYLESTVSAIETTKLSDEKLEMANKVAQREIIASGALAEAKRIVLSESEAGIALTKRALSSFADSDFDVGHIRNIGKTLNTVRGGMQMLKCDRAATVLRRCSQFVNETLMDQNPPPAIKEMLETFADAVISVEYYINSANNSLIMDESVLKLAEESMEALGYPVDGEDPEVEPDYE